MKPVLTSLLLICAVASSAFAEKTNVFFVHGANVSESDARTWASEMFKRLWQAGADMEFYPVAWESDIGPSYNYQVNASNAFVTASRLASFVNAVSGRRVVIAHSLGTMVAAAAIQDYGMSVEKLIMLNSAIPSFMGTTDWSGWGFRTSALGLVRTWSEAEANAIADFTVFKTNTVFALYPSSITNAANPRLVIDAHLTQGIPSLSPATGRTDLTQYGIPSFDLNALKSNSWPRTTEDPQGDGFLHSDIKNVAYFFTHAVFSKIIEVGGLK
jgi:pimeloyl-ACP methyl ester carboxylesterase